MGTSDHPNPESRSAVRWVATPEALRALIQDLADAPAIALDTESDSLHSFPEKVCLVQIAEGDGVSLLDPLALRDLSGLAPLLADRAIITVLHGAAYDLASMKRDFGFEFSGVFDTMLAAQFLGLPSLGLASLLEQFFRIRPGASRQKDDWARRPLTPAQVSYAAEDVRYLIPLRACLLDALRAVGRETWVEEECEALAAVPPSRRIFDPEDYVRLRGARGLDRRGLAVLRELFVAREALACETGRPPFKILGTDSLLHLARERPATREALRGIPGCSAKVVQRYGDSILGAIAGGMAKPEMDLPRYPRPAKPRIPPPVQRRIDALLRWREAAAARLGLEAGVVLPRRLVEQVSEECPTHLESLGHIPGFRRWRIQAFGEAILAALRGADPSGWALSIRS